jgi:hypothetical protein
VGSKHNHWQARRVLRLRGFGHSAGWHIHMWRHAGSWAVQQGCTLLWGPTQSLPCRRMQHIACMCRHPPTLAHTAAVASWDMLAVQLQKANAEARRCQRAEEELEGELEELRSAYDLLRGGQQLLESRLAECAADYVQHWAECSSSLAVRPQHFNHCHAMVLHRFLNACSTRACCPGPVTCGIQQSLAPCLTAMWQQSKPGCMLDSGSGLKFTKQGHMHHRFLVAHTGHPCKWLSVHP